MQCILNRRYILHSQQAVPRLLPQNRQVLPFSLFFRPKSTLPGGIRYDNHHILILLSGTQCHLLTFTVQRALRAPLLKSVYTGALMSGSHSPCRNHHIRTRQSLLKNSIRDHIFTLKQKNISNIFPFHA